MVKFFLLFLFFLASFNLFADRPASYYRNLPSLDILKCENVLLKDKNCINKIQKSPILKVLPPNNAPKCEIASISDRVCVDKTGKKIYRPDERRYFSPVL